MTSTMTQNRATLAWHCLSGPQFEEALSGTFDQNYKRLTQPWLDSPKLHYYMHRSCLVRGPDTRVFFIATEASSRKSKSLATAVAMLEVEFESGSTTTVGIKYVTVYPNHRGQGLATKLYGMLIEHLKREKLQLYRTRPGKDTPEEFTAAMTRLLDQEGVAWHSREY